jgi:hypothetical protein
MQSCSAKTNNAYNRQNDVYNSTGTLHQAAFQVSILSARLPVDADVQAFFINTNQSLLHES